MRGSDKLALTPSRVDANLQIRSKRDSCFYTLDLSDSDFSLLVIYPLFRVLHCLLMHS